MTTPENGRPRVLVRATERGAPDSGSHPYNPRSEVHGWLLSRPAGLRRIAVNQLWVPAGKESSELHRHYREEEWVFVLEGCGVAEVDDAEHEIGPGDFLGFPPGVAHNLRAAPDARLDLLVGGEIIHDVEVADFPRQRRRLARFGARLAVYPMEAEVPLFPGGSEVPPELLGAPPPARPRVLVRAGERGPEQAYHRTESPATEVRLTELSRPAGLTRVAAGLTRVPAGRTSWPKHLHHHHEEWLFVLTGQGIAEVGEKAHGIGPGDFLGYPAGGPAHQVRAGASADLAFLHGGDAWSGREVEIVDYPALGRRKTFTGASGALTFSLDDALERRR